MLYWFGQLVSVAGSQMQVWALFWHVSKLSPDPIAVSGIGLARFIPILIFSLIGGASADKLNRRVMLFVTQSAMAFVALSLAILTFTGRMQLWHIYALTAVQAVAISFDNPARQSLVPNLVGDRRDLPSAFSLQSIAFNTGAIVGPALSGLVIAHVGQGYTYLINAFSFASVIAALALMGHVPQQIQASVASARRRLIDIDSIRDGLRFTFSQPIILSSMILDFLATFFSSANTLLPYVAQQILRVGAVEYGWLSAAQSIGSVGVAFVLSQRHDLRRQGKILLGSVAVFGAATVVFGLSRGFWLTLVALFFIGAADTVSAILRSTVRQLQTPDSMRGRMISVNQIFFMGGPQLGEVEAGAVAQAFGVPAAIISGGIGCILAVAFVGTRWPHLRNYNGDEAPAEA